MDELSKLNTLKQAEDFGLFGGWVKPRFLEIRGDSLAYSLLGNTKLMQPDKKAINPLLRDFVSLDTASDEAILRFARGWGVLGLCKHGLPAAHEITTSKRPSVAQPFKYCDLKTQGNWCYEPLERWRHYARQVRAIASLAYMPSLLKQEEESPGAVAGINAWGKGKVEIKGLHGDEEDWKALFGDMRFNLLKPDRVLVTRNLLALAIEGLFNLTHIRPVFTWTDRKPDFHFIGRGLFETIVMQLVLNVSRARGLSRCQECTNTFFIDEGQESSSFCPDCHRKIRHREAVRRFTNKNKQNPNRKKRNRLSTTEREQIAKTIAKAKEQGKYGSKLLAQLAKQYGVTEWAIYKIKANARK